MAAGLPHTLYRRGMQTTWKCCAERPGKVAVLPWLASPYTRGCAPLTCNKMNILSCNISVENITQLFSKLPVLYLKKYWRDFSYEIDELKNIQLCNGLAKEKAVM